MAKWQAHTDVPIPNFGDRELNPRVKLFEDPNLLDIEDDINQYLAALPPQLPDDTFLMLMSMEVHVVTGFQGNPKQRYFAKVVVGVLGPPL